MNSDAACRATERHDEISKEMKSKPTEVGKLEEANGGTSQGPAGQSPIICDRDKVAACVPLGAGKVSCSIKPKPANAAFSHKSTLLFNRGWDKGK